MSVEKSISTGNGIEPVLVLNRFQFPNDQELKFSHIRSYLDLALTCAQAAGKSTPLNYAIKVLSRGHDKDNSGDTDEVAPRKLSLRAKRMYAQEAINLALAYPYLTPLLDEYVFTPYWHDGLREKIAVFSTALIEHGLRRLYPDAVAHAIFLALKYEISVALKDDRLIEIVKLDDCVANVLLLEYAKLRARKKVKLALTKRAIELKTSDKRERDKHWLLLYQVWSKPELNGNGQGFLSELKGKGFQFFSLPKPPVKKPVAEAD